MASNGTGRSGSRENLDDPRHASVQRPAGYDRQYTRNQTPAAGQQTAQPPSYAHYENAGYNVSQPSAQPRYAERSVAPVRSDDVRPADQYQPRSRSQSPARFLEDPAERQTAYRDRSYSPGRTLDPDTSPARAQPPGYGHPDSQSGYPLQRGYPPSQAGYPSSQDGYSQQRGYPPSQTGYPSSQDGYSQQRGYPPSQTGYPSAGYGPSQPGMARPSYTQPPSQRGYQPLTPGRLPYATRYTKPKHTTATKDGGYYNVYTDAVVKTRKVKAKKGGMTTFLAVTRPWNKNHSNQPRDFMPLVIASIFFNPIVGLAALIMSCMTTRAVTHEDWAKAGKYGRISFWMAIAAIISGIIALIVIFATLHNQNFAAKLH